VLFVYFPEPPYFMLIAGLLASLASGAALSGALKQLVQEWSTHTAISNLSANQGTQLLVPFLGIVAGACVFLGSGIESFGFPTLFAYAIALPMMMLIGRLLWVQLIENLGMLGRSGSRALDLDVPEYPE
jgi:hypothetical protein